LTTNILFINQFPDTVGDAKTGKNHLVVTYGKKFSRWIYLFFLVSAFISSFFLADLFKGNLIYFNEAAFLIGNGLLFLYGLSAFINLFKNYNSRDLIFSNLKTIYLQIFFGLFYVIILNFFFI